MKKVLICMLQLHKNSGSARTAFENIRYFKSRGFEVHVASLTIDLPLIESLGAIPHKLLPWLKATGVMRRKWYNFQVKALRKKLKPEITVGHGDIQDQDVVTLHNCVFLASELIQGKPLSKTNEMYQVHGKLLSKKTFKKLIANSELMKLDTVNRFKVDAEKIHVIYPSLDTKTFHPVSVEEKKQLRERFGFSDRVVIAFVTSGNFKKRGLDIFINSIKILEPKIRELCEFRVIGKDSSKEYESPFLIFDPPIEDIQNYFNAIDVFVLPARIEEFGRVVLEAMGCGLPVITTDMVGAAETLESISCEFIIPPEDPKALAESIEALAQDPVLRSMLGEQNSLSAQAHSEDLVSEKFDEVFKSLS